MYHITPVILCGGSGARLWPLSRSAFPKKFLVLSGKTTLFQQQNKPEDCLIETGHQFSVRQFIQWAAEELGIQLHFEGKVINEKAIVESILGDKAPTLRAGDVIMQIYPRYFRPAKVETLLGESSKAKSKLGWESKITAQEMCCEMVKNDLEETKSCALLKSNGYSFS